MMRFRGTVQPVFAAELPKHPEDGLDDLEDLEEDFHQDIARSSFADMLHDHDRNQKYYQGIRAAVSRVKARGERVVVLDIGTGTGLLSMMAVTAGADVCYAVEVFAPMAAAARSIVQKNGFSEQITVINKHSTAVTVGAGGDMASRANVLLTELFDTELIGEGALSAYEHAHLHLVQSGCEAVPHRATVYATLVQSERLWSWAHLQPLAVGGSQLLPYDALSRCPGSHAVCDLQLSQLPRGSLSALSPRLTMFSVDFSRAVSSEPQTHCRSFEAQSSGEAQVVLSWWDLSMDPDNTIVCSMAPSWTYEDPHSAPWRDHWMQSVYFLPEQSSVSRGQDLTLTVSHDDYSLWYSLSQGPQGLQGTRAVPRPCCTCLAHTVWDRPRFGQLGDRALTQQYVSALQQVLGPDSVVLSISDCSLLPLMARLLGARTVFSVEGLRLSRQVVQQLLETNHLSGSVELLEGPPEELRAEDLRGQQVSVLLGEPYFSSSLLPWHSLRFWYSRSAVAPLLAPDARVLPRGASLHMVPVHFEQLWRIRAPCGSCEGFDVSPMDQMIQRSLDYREAGEAEPHALWEYPCQALGPPTALLTFDFTQCVPEETMSSSASLRLSSSSCCHAVVLWMEYHLTQDIRVSTGLSGPVGAGGQCQWSPHHKQAVFFFSPALDSGDHTLSYTCSFEPRTGDLTMDLSLDPHMDPHRDPK
ncbi:unnamed protein product [Knipowitschia caucasica]|uniref:Protein arginine N-methyltransferase n=1 Tax=Knipowitschia caucasica TaxID=637954 RepID=A0AAV2KAU2_KNICA